MFYSTDEEKLKSAISLSMVLDSYNKMDSLDLEKRIEDNIVTIYNVDGRNLKNGTGLRLTEDGFILTADHNIKELKEKSNRKYYAFDNTEKGYKIDTSFITSYEKYDLALIKAITHNDPKPIEYNFLDRKLAKNEEIRLYTTRDRILHEAYGEVINDNSLTKTEIQIIDDTFSTNIDCEIGFSGGVFTTVQNEIAGVLLFSNNDTKCAGGVPIFYAQQLIAKLSYDLRKSALLI